MPVVREEENLFGQLQPREPVAFDALTVRFVCQGPPCSGLALLNPGDLGSPAPVFVRVIEWQAEPDWSMEELAGDDRGVWWLLPTTDEIEVLA